MKYLLFFICMFFGFVVCAQEQNDVNETITIDTSYVLIPPIAETCKNIVFTDSMFRAWNNASAENIRALLLKRPNDCLERELPGLIKGDNYRLSFCKVLNDDSFITKEDFTKGFFIIEKWGLCGIPNIRRYLFTDNGKNFKLVIYRFNNPELPWISIGEKTIRKNKFYKFYNKVKKQDEEKRGLEDFIVTEFKEDKIRSFVFICGWGCGKCFIQFDDLVGKFAPL